MRLVLSLFLGYIWFVVCFMVLVSDCLMFIVFFESLLFPLLFSLILFSFSNSFVFALYCFICFSAISSILCLLLLSLFVSHFNCFVFDVWLDFGWDSLFLWCFLWLLLFFVFSIKYPLWPLHAWLPEVHVETSTEVSVVLASIILNVGFFGMYNFLCFNLFMSFLGF